MRAWSVLRVWPVARAAGHENNIAECSPQIIHKYQTRTHVLRAITMFPPNHSSYQTRTHVLRAIEHSAMDQLTCTEQMSTDDDAPSKQAA